MRPVVHGKNVFFFCGPKNGFFGFRPVVHGKKNRKKRGKNKTVFLFCPKKVVFCLVHGKKRKKQIFFESKTRFIFHQK